MRLVPPSVELQPLLGELLLLLHGELRQTLLQLVKVMQSEKVLQPVKVMQPVKVLQPVRRSLLVRELHVV